MALEYDGHRIGAMQYDGVTIGEAMMDGQVVYQSGLPVVQITGTGGTVSRDQFRQACIDFGTTYDTVEVLPFQLDTSQSTAMTNFFYGCTSLTSVPDLDTSQVTIMRSMFYGCSSLTTAPEMNTGNVTDMISMFRNCSSLTTVPGLDTSQVTDINSMFYGCSSLTTAPEMNTGNVTNMAFMFQNCSSLTTVPDLDTSQVTNVNSMLRNCSSLTDGNVRLIGKHPSVYTANMIAGSGLTREPWYNADGSPLRYVASGSGGGIPRLTRDVWTTIATHTVSATGQSSGTWQVMWRGGYFMSDTDVRVLRNGVVIAINSREATEGWQQVSIPEVSLSSGDNLTFQAQWRGTPTASGRYVDSWSWSLS